jgi:hypothetical protein
MSNQLNPISDTQIMSYIDQNNAVGWRNLYDKYALNMYVAILWVVNNEKEAEETLRLVFSQLKDSKALLFSKNSLSASVLYNAHTTALKVKAIHDLKFSNTYTSHNYFPRLTKPLLLKNAVKAISKNKESLTIMLRPELN